MRQLVQLQNRMGDQLLLYGAQVLVVFREESEGQDGLQKVANRIDADFTLAIDFNAQNTYRYSPGERRHDSYIVDARGVIRAILPGTRYDRAQWDEFDDALIDISLDDLSSASE